MSQRCVERQCPWRQPFRRVASGSRMFLWWRYTAMTSARPTAASAAATAIAKRTKMTPVAGAWRRAEAPEGDEIQVGRVEHELDARAGRGWRCCAPGRAGEADGEEQRSRRRGRAAGGSWRVLPVAGRVGRGDDHGADQRRPSEGRPTTRSAAACGPMSWPPSWRTVTEGRGAGADRAAGARDGRKRGRPATATPGKRRRRPRGRATPAARPTSSARSAG